MYLDEDIQQYLWEDISHELTIYNCIGAKIEGTGDMEGRASLSIGNELWLIPGDLLLSGFEDELSSAWPDALVQR